LDKYLAIPDSVIEHVIKKFGSSSPPRSSEERKITLDGIFEVHFGG